MGTAVDNQMKAVHSIVCPSILTYRLVNLQPFLLFISFSPGNVAVLWCTCYTNVFKSVTNLFIKNLACSGICAGLVCVPFYIVLNASPLCCLWVHTLMLCKTIKFLHRLFCSATVLSFAVIALDRYYSVLYPLERKISDAKSRDLVIYIWVHAVCHKRSRSQMQVHKYYSHSPQKRDHKRRPMKSTLVGDRREILTRQMTDNTVQALTEGRTKPDRNGSSPEPGRDWISPKNKAHQSPRENRTEFTRGQVHVHPQVCKFWN
ncbi:neuropeptide FF receptor 2-like [Pseudorasbora parva]|uniref:neuropeptide FF receptor 2-like n=1 Tax=Pseudorasbora parva TaxID=51549 RepID=UPI00351E529B